VVAFYEIDEPSPNLVLALITFYYILSNQGLYDILINFYDFPSLCLSFMVGLSWFIFWWCNAHGYLIA